MKLPFPHALILLKIYNYIWLNDHILSLLPANNILINKINNIILHKGLLLIFSYAHSHHILI